MTKAALGSFANLASYLTIVSTVTGCDFHTSIIRSKYDFEGDLDSYAFSVLTLNYLIVGIVSVLGFIFRDFIFDSILHIDKSYGIILILYLLLFPAYNIFATLQRVNYRYKVFSALSLTYAVSSVGAVLLLLNILPNGLTARVVGQYGPIIVIGFALSLYLAFRGKTVRLSYWKYALTMCLPLLPHFGIHLRHVRYWENGSATDFGRRSYCCICYRIQRYAHPIASGSVRQPRLGALDVGHDPYR